MANVPCFGECSTEHTGVLDNNDTRRWCHACNEWCYPNELCVRAEEVVLTRKVALLRELLAAEHFVDDGVPHERSEEWPDPVCDELFGKEEGGER